MSANAPAKLTIKDYKSDLHNDWCPGCGDFGILTGIQMALAQLQLDPDKVAVFSGIGCSGKTTHYINAYGFHTLHGRVLTVATGGRPLHKDPRAYALEPKHLASILVQAVRHKGSALVDVLQTCPTYNDLYTKEWYEGADLPEKRSRLYKLEERGYDGKVREPSDQQEIIAKKSAAVARSYETDPIPIGIYYQIDLPTYEDAVFQRIPALKDTPLVEQDLFHRDVTPLLEAMR